MNITLDMLHDAELNAISHNRVISTVCLSFLTPDCVIAEAVFDGVCGFRVVDYGQQNVVSRLLISLSDHFSHDEIIQRVAWVSTTCEGHSLLSANALENMVGKIESNKLFLLVLEPSWGAEISVVARTIFWRIK